MNSFEYNQSKSVSNYEKHGINFIEAQNLWNDPEFVEVMAHSEKEPRALVIGLIGEKHWTSVITYRGENIRIISVRRSRKSEVELYES
ncbi:MAG: BrnT family toxin [Spirochaetia bacterium]|jgi:uncharacterized DUF497 family protein|nr:BrnT family toxin [Spirochaetia bacterium]